MLDFRNEAEEITKAFAPYYAHAYAAPTDPNLMYDARTELDRHDVIRPDDPEAVAAAATKLTLLSEQCWVIVPDTSVPVTTVPKPFSVNTRSTGRRRFRGG